MPREYHHNSPTAVRGYLSAALELVADLEPPDDLREATFTKAVDLLSTKQVFIDPAELSPVVRGVAMVPH